MNNINKLYIFSYFCILCTSCNTPTQKTNVVAGEKYFNQRIELAISDFSVKHKTDTLDFNNFDTFAWDSIYVFNGTYTRSSLDLGWNWINWDSVLQEGYLIREHVNRFAFINNGHAIKYIDISTENIRDIHYHKYFRDERGYLHTYKDEIITSHFMPANCFARKKAKFILVYPTEVSKSDSAELMYAKAEYFTGKNHFSGQLISRRGFAMHPISGCGLPNCLANKIKK